MTKNEFLALADKYEDGQCSQEEKAVLFEFCKKTQTTDTVLAWDLSKSEALKIQLLHRINSKIDALEVQPKQTPKELPEIKHRFIAWKIAASLLFFVALGYGIYNVKYNNEELVYMTRTTGKGEVLRLLLEDSSVVHLNAESSLHYPEKFGSDQRTVILQGEAFFEITKNDKKPFKVTSQNVVTEVLGTSFNIQAYPEEATVQVTVATGKVKVSDPEAHQIFLRPEHQAVFNKKEKKLLTKKVALHHFLGWKEGIIALDNTTLNETVKILNRWYNVNFVFENEASRNCILNGEFKRDELSNLLENIAFVTGLKFEKLPDNTIRITGTTCN